MGEHDRPAGLQAAGKPGVPQVVDRLPGRTECLKRQLVASLEFLIFRLRDGFQFQRTEVKFTATVEIEKKSRCGFVVFRKLEHSTDGVPVVGIRLVLPNVQRAFPEFPIRSFDLAKRKRNRSVKIVPDYRCQAAYAPPGKIPETEKKLGTVPAAQKSGIGAAVGILPERCPAIGELPMSEIFIDIFRKPPLKTAFPLHLSLIGRNRGEITEQQFS